MKKQNRNILYVCFLLVFFICGCTDKPGQQSKNKNQALESENIKGSKPMVVKVGSNVIVQYEGRLENGEIFDKSKEEQPLEFTVGGGQIISGFDEAVVGMKIGEEKEITIEPENAYGLRKEEYIKDVPRDKLPEDINLEVGMVLRRQSPSGQSIPVIVTGFDEEIVKVDFNHPLAGKKLIFKITIIDIKQD